MAGDYPFAPRLDAALELVEEMLPARTDDLEFALAGEGIAQAPFDLRGLKTAAEELFRELPFQISRQGNYNFVMGISAGNVAEVIRREARRSVEHWGTSTVFDLTARVTDLAGESVDENLVAEVIRMQTDFEWLDEESGWFWLASVPRNRLINQVEKIMSVAPRIHISELRDGVRRHHRMKGFAPPKRVLSEMCRRTPGYRVEGHYVLAEPPLDWIEVLAGNEESMARILFQHGPLLTGGQFEKLFVDAGLNRSTFYVYLGYSPIIERYAPQVYGLRGADIPPGLAESLVPKAKRKRNVQDHGWTKGGEVWIAYRLTDNMIHSGVIGVPAAIKQFVEGEFALSSEEGAHVGTLVAKNTLAWGIGPFFRRRGGEAGDTLLLVVSPASRSATAYIGNEELLDNAAAGKLPDSKGKMVPAK